jgi:hypothetical protein
VAVGNSLAGKVKTTGFGTADAEGTLFFPAGMASIFDFVELKTVLPIDISWLS